MQYLTKVRIESAVFRKETGFSPLSYKKRGLSVLRCSQISGLPYTTLLELVRKKTDLKKCTAETVYKLAKALNTSVEELLEQHDQEQLVTFEEPP